MPRLYYEYTNFKILMLKYNKNKTIKNPQKNPQTQPVGLQFSYDIFGGIITGEGSIYMELKNSKMVGLQAK